MATTSCSMVICKFTTEENDNNNDSILNFDVQTDHQPKDQTQ